MSKSFKNDLTGQRFGRLTVLEFVPREGTSKAFWRCRCDCGNTTVVYGNFLRTGHTRSCGCIKIEQDKDNLSKLLHGKRRRGETTRLYNIWASMKQRCYNSNNPNYINYGGRGIRICDEWKNDFQAFYDWAMANGYDDNLTIDRIDNDGNYDPDNCQWADRKTQNRNKRDNIIVEYDGKNMHLVEVAVLLQIPIKTMYTRYYSGDRGERLFRPVESKN